MIRNLTIAAATLAAALAATIGMTACGTTTTHTTTGPPAAAAAPISVLGYAAQIPGQAPGVTYPANIYVPAAQYSISPTNPQDGTWQQTVNTGG